MFLEILEFRVENKKNCLGKTVFKMWSQICEQMAYVSTKFLLEKVQILKKIKTKTMKVYTIFGGFW